MKEDLIKKAEIIIKELNLEDAKITEKWMAHYMAELVEKYELSNINEDKLEIGKECRNLILVLWEFMIREKELEIERIIGIKEKNLNENVEILYPILNTSLNEPENVSNLENKEKIELLKKISELESKIVYFYTLSKYFSQIVNQENPFSPREIGLFNYYKESITEAFPFFKYLEIENQNLVEKSIFSAFGILNNLRNLFFNIEKEK